MKKQLLLLFCITSMLSFSQQVFTGWGFDFVPGNSVGSGQLRTQLFWTNPDSSAIMLCLEADTTGIIVPGYDSAAVPTTENRFLVADKYGVISVRNISSFLKHQETYSGTTDVTGIYSVTFATPYSVAPNIQVTLKGSTDQQSYDGLTVTTTGFSVHVYERTYTMGVSNGTTDVSGIGIDVLITEK